MLSHYTHYFFDADGTMIDTEEMVYQCYLYTCRKYGGFEIDRKRVTSLMGIPFVPQIIQYLGKMDQDKLLEVRTYYKAYQDEIYQDYLKLFPGIKDVLIKLKEKGKKLAVVSSRTKPTLLKYLEEVGILDLFDLIVYPERTENHKPHPEPVEYALSELSGKPGETLFIGDADFDIKSGQAAGTDTALVAWGPNKPEELESKPHFILDDLNLLVD